MVRRNNDEGTGVSLDPGRFPPLQAPAGSKRTRSRDSKGGSPYPTNNTDLPLPDGTIRTKHGDKELRTGHFNMLAHKCKGDPWEQHRQLQMLKGVYKTTRCRFELSGGRCNKGRQCCFSHATDNDHDIDAVVMPFRHRVLTELYDEGFSPFIEILHEIGKMTRSLWRLPAEGRSMREELKSASRGLGCTITLGLRGVVRAIAIVQPQTQIVIRVGAMVTPWP